MELQQQELRKILLTCILYHFTDSQRTWSFVDFAERLNGLYVLIAPRTYKYYLLAGKSAVKTRGH